MPPGACRCYRQAWCTTVFFPAVYGTQKKVVIAIAKLAARRGLKRFFIS